MAGSENRLALVYSFHGLTWTRDWRSNTIELYLQLIKLNFIKKTNQTKL
uniref:ATTAP1 n=1 Tax=Arundo donax TaxID=35708 RepID=A0A0A8Z4R1_ARUDO